MYNIISNIIFYMPHDFRLQHIRISISTLSKYVRINKHKRKQKKGGHLYRVVSAPGTNAPLPRRGGVSHLYRGGTPPGTNVYICTGYLARYKCATLICTGRFVPVQCPVQMRVMARYKWWFFQ